MGLDAARYGATRLAEELYERAIGVGHELAARDNWPKTPEEFAASVVHCIFDALPAGVMMLNKEQGWHPDDPRWDRPPT